MSLQGFNNSNFGLVISTTCFTTTDLSNTSREVIDSFIGTFELGNLTSDTFKTFCGVPIPHFFREGRKKSFERKRNVMDFKRIPMWLNYLMTGVNV